MSDTPALRKARGAFFTPTELSRFIAEWAVRSANDTVLEPSCGEAGFLLQAGSQIAKYGVPRRGFHDHLHGIEIHRASAEVASAVLSAEGFGSDIKIADFFDVPPNPVYDAVIGNPPYVRYQDFAGKARMKGLQAALAQGVRLTGLANSWAAFVIHAAQFLKPSGRLGLILPAELLTVNYAAQVRRFLLERFQKVRLVMFDSRVFPGVLQEVVLLLAEGTGGAPSFELYQSRDVNDLARVDKGEWTAFAPKTGEKWTPALLPSSAVSVYRDLSTGNGFSSLIEWGETYLGAVTGNNNYFALSKEKITDLALSPKELIAISPPGSRHLRSLRFSQKAWEALENDGARCYLFAPYVKKPSAAACRYIEEGEKFDVQKAYKCRSRSPWWRVPTVSVPDLFFTYMNHDRPRLITNEANAHHLNSVFGILLKPELRALGREWLPLASLNSVTILGAEIVGRAYGGGLLKLEPKEADILPMPSQALLDSAASGLDRVRPLLVQPLRQGDLAQAIEIVDRVMLEEQLGVSRAKIELLRRARDALFFRRKQRSKGNRR